ncbi:maleylpyruvate isomerase N-terminal domain-containing protein [Streptomyces sp. SID3343]|uniref:maleylpyruvate isomerase N-terminal domain-containing protein n=1 Tax=Streptomyces sp. SID3343 TaxID=2690260 RepID=UPI00136D7CE4|nr:maleylpyruvate isomerase N-terminal domain-containing protein [Streptomyces sp. SID3343]MYW06063.1 hypothetical protein [Streptomyces sp. SID3343]
MTTRLETLETLRSDGGLFVRAAERVGLDAPLPTCPNRLLRDLLAHLGSVHRQVTVGTGIRPPERPARARTAAAFVAGQRRAAPPGGAPPTPNLLKALAAAKLVSDLPVNIAIVPDNHNTAWTQYI